MQPKVKFKIDYKKDIRTLQNFVNDAKFDGGRNLQWAVFRLYPELKNCIDVKKGKIEKKQIELFVKKMYLKNKGAINQNLNVYKSNWQRKERAFYDLTSQIFGGHKWPKGKYIAYFTIWGMFPRFLKDKTFQIPHKFRRKRYLNVIIAHEMLHFIFYDYFYEHYSKYEKDKYGFFVWHISEIFNEIVQNSPKWLKVFKLKTMGYPEHKNIVKKLSKKFYRRENIDINVLIKDILKAVQKIT